VGGPWLPGLPPSHREASVPEPTIQDVGMRSATYRKAGSYRCPEFPPHLGLFRGREGWSLLQPRAQLTGCPTAIMRQCTYLCRVSVPGLRALKNSWDGIITGLHFLMLPHFLSKVRLRAETVPHSSFCPHTVLSTAFCSYQVINKCLLPN
jgi:hypothetical protein